MRHLSLLVIALAFASCACAEEWVDFDAPTVGAGGVGMLARGPGGAHYNPANAALRPWERTEKDPMRIEFNLPASFTAAIHGEDFQKMFDVVQDANDVYDKFQSGAFNNPTSATLNDYRDVFDIFGKLDVLDSLNGEGVYATSSAGLGARVSNLFLPGDGLSINVGGFAVAGAATIVDLDSLRNYRFVDESGAQWDTMITAAATLSGQPTKSPTTAAGQQFSSDLQAAGYPAAQADILAATAEESGINLNGVGASILFDFLVNTQNGTGQSLESGANPLEGNGSGFVIRGLAFYSVAVSYGFPLPIPLVGKWLSVGATVRFIQAYTFSHLLLVQDMNSNGVKDTLSSLSQQTKDAYTFKSDASRFNVGLDLGVIFTPQLPLLDTLAVSLTARNINGPEFRWNPATNVEPRLIRFDPQFIAGASYTLFNGVGLPLTFAVEGDLNPISSDILPRYHTQFVRGAVTFEPQFGIFGLGVRTGIFKNIADANQAFTLTAGLGLRLWFFHLDFAGQVGLTTADFGPTSDSRAIPQRFGFSVDLGLAFTF